MKAALFKMIYSVTHGLFKFKVFIEVYKSYKEDWNAVFNVHNADFEQDLKEKEGAEFDYLQALVAAQGEWNVFDFFDKQEILEFGVFEASHELLIW